MILTDETLPQAIEEKLAPVKKPYDGPFQDIDAIRPEEIAPPDKELPSLSSLCGIDPNATGETDSVAFVRARRDEGD